MKNKKLIRLALLCTPSIILTSKTWLWLVGILPTIDPDRAGMGILFCTVNIIASSIIVFELGD